MMERLKDIGVPAGKKLASFDVTALFTNVPVKGALNAIKRVLDEIDETNLPLPKTHFMKMISLCMEFNCFCFNGTEYLQHSGLAMGSPLSPVGACLYMEDLEQSKFLNIMGADSEWMRYVDDVLVVVPENMDINERLSHLNAVNSNIQFTVEMERDGELAFLDTCIVRTDGGFKFKVHRKPSNKEDYVHFYSAHGERVKSGIVIGFFLRALRVCDDEYLPEEIQHIYSTFSGLKYPRGFLIKQKKKAEEIMKRKQNEAANRKAKPDKLITIPFSKQAGVISTKLAEIGVRVVQNSGKTIRDIVTTKNDKKTAIEKSVVYEVPCAGCYKTYVGETGRGVEIRLREHQNDVRFHRTSNAIVLHIDECKHLPKWKDTKILEKNIRKRHRKTLEAAHIMSRNTYNTRSGFVTWANLAAKLAVGGS